MICLKSTLCLSAVAMSAVFALALGPVAQEEGMPTPTPEHGKILAGVGDWEGSLTMFDMPGAKPEPVPAKEKVTGIGGFWVLSDFTCEFMGMPYHGSGHVGYDAEKKKYVGTWVDSMSSYFSLMEGEYDASKKALVMRWQAPDMTGQMAAHRSESTETADTRTMTFYTGEGEGTKTMVIEMKRKGRSPAEAGAKK